MITPPVLQNEQERLWELYNYEILDTAHEEEFDDIVKLASQICNVPISLISLVETNRQWNKAKVGLDVTETSFETSFCAHAIATDTDFFEVEDASKDERFFDNPLVANAPNIRFYAGVPLVTQQGLKLGTLCVIDYVPHHLTDEQSFALKVLGNQVIKLLNMRMNNRKLAAQQQQLKQQAEMQNRIISVMAHDVRSPLAAMKQIMELINSNILSAEDAKKLFVMAEKNLDSTLILLADLLTWGKMQMNAVSDIKMEPFDLHELVSQKLKQVEVAAQLKHNNLVNLVDTDLKVNSNESSFRFILRNLLSNANKFTENGTITVYAQREADKVLISISDTGVGMDEITRNKLLSGRGKVTTLGTKKESGSGLGMVFTKDFIEMLGGTLTIKSQKDRGTTFYIELQA